MVLGIFSHAAAEPPKVGSEAPLFTLTAHDGTPFSLADRRGHGWTVLYFYPKADTPGCTKQACAFRDALSAITAQGAAVFGISGDTVEQQRAFHDEHKLGFTLLADPDAVVIEKYGAKLPLLRMAKRWTFLVDPQLRIRWVEQDVDPLLDAQRVAEQLRMLQAGN